MNYDVLEDVGIVVPYYGSDRWRMRNFERVVTQHLETLGAAVIIASADLPFSPGTARNIGAEQMPDEVEILYFNDADSLVPAAQIVEACEVATIAPGLVFAFTDYLRLDENDEPYAYIQASGSSGAVAIRRDCFEDVDGYNEEFVGWGYEDLDFARRCSERWPIRRVSGELRHLWHPPSGGRTEAERDVPVTHEQILNLQFYESLARLG